MSGDACGCYACDEAIRAANYAETGDFAAYICRFMIVCPTCGNKRCPRATHHGNPCTASNDPGQSGSRYA